MIRDLFGEEVADLRYYWCWEGDLDGIPVVVSRTGWTGEVGYEIYLRDGSRGIELWDRVMEAGEPYDIRAIAPSDQRRLEAGIFNYGNDMGVEDTPFHVTGMERLVEFSADFIGKDALAAGRGRGRRPQARRRGDRRGAAPDVARGLLARPRTAARSSGKLTSASHSFRLEKNIGYAWVPIELAEPGTELELVSPDGPVPAATVAAAVPRPEQGRPEVVGVRRAAAP